jgi:hypothetical protein
MAGPESIDPEPNTGEGLVGRGAIAACLVLSGALPSPLASATIVALPEQARILKLLIERVDVQADGLEVRLRAEGLASFVAELRQQPLAPAKAA